MSKFSETMVSDDSLPEEIVHYKPISPMAATSLLFGLGSVVAAITVADVGWAFIVVPVIGFVLGFRGLRSIKRYDMTGRGAAKVGIILSALALVGGTGGYLYYLKTAIPPGYLPITYEPLQTAMPEELDSTAKALEGKKVYLQGYVYPTKETTGIKTFMLCRDNGTCCFGGQPKLTDMVEVKLKEPLTLDYTSSLHGVGGVFRVKSEGAGKLGNVVYHLDNADVLH